MQIRTSIISFILLSTLVAGCTLGFKSWPKPEEAQDTFSWRSVTLQMAGDSLIIEGRLQGAFDNFQYVRLTAEPLTADACPKCPFKPSIAKEYRPGDPGFELIGPWMKIQLTGLDATIPYRVQLIGTNRLTGLATVPSEIVRIDP